MGNVPFGQYRVNDKAYNKLGFSIHNYFFAKAIDQVRPGGIVAFVTSRYTLDSKDSSARKHIAERADLLGAIRLPNTAFKANAGTEVVSDIIFLQKRDRPIDHEPDWVQLGKTEDGFAINSYFVDHPEMVLGLSLIHIYAVPRTRRTVNREKVTDHHAILPTHSMLQADLDALPKGEQNILKLIIARTLMAVSKPFRYLETLLTTECAGEEFTAKGKEILDEGWKAIERKVLALSLIHIWWKKRSLTAVCI